MEPIKLRKKNRELALLRKKLGLTQMDVGIASNGVINYTKVSHFENGYILPTEEEVKVLASILRVSKEDIIRTFRK